jgi:hypothetical protein
MRNPTLSGFAYVRRVKSAFHISTNLLLIFCVLVFAGSLRVAAAQDSKPAAPPTSPSPGKALVYIYRVSRFVGSAAHDHLYINGTYLAYLLNGEYAWMEVAPGTVVVTGFPKMYYGSIIMSAGAALSDARTKENERIRFEAEAGKTYYLKWTSETMATGIKVTPMDPGVGAKEMSKLHLSKPVEQPDGKKEEGK